MVSVEFQAFQKERLFYLLTNVTIPKKFEIHAFGMFLYT